MIREPAAPAVVPVCNARWMDWQSDGPDVVDADDDGEAGADDAGVVLGTAEPDPLAEAVGPAEDELEPQAATRQSAVATAARPVARGSARWIVDDVL